MAITALFLNPRFVLPSTHHQEGVILLLHLLLQQSVLHAGYLRGICSINLLMAIKFWVGKKWCFSQGHHLDSMIRTVSISMGGSTNFSFHYFFNIKF